MGETLDWNLEDRERREFAAPMVALAKELIDEMGPSPQDRLDWMSKQTAYQFTRRLTRINALARGLDPSNHGFDGEGVVVGALRASVPPDHVDKGPLLANLLQKTEGYIKIEQVNGAPTDHMLQVVQMAVPTVINKLHPFRNGNGRTTRFLRMLLSDGPAASHDGYRSEVRTVLDAGTEFGYTAKPLRPIEQSISWYISQINDTGFEPVEHDVFKSHSNTPVDVMNAQTDVDNFNQVMRHMKRAAGTSDPIRVREMLGWIRAEPRAHELFTHLYRNVRIQRVQAMIGGLLGMPHLKLIGTDENDKFNTTDMVQNQINAPRRRINLPSVDPTSIQTIQDFQLAYTQICRPLYASY